MRRVIELLRNQPIPVISDPRRQTQRAHDLSLIGVVLSFPPLLFLSTFPFVALMSLFALTFVTLCVAETFSLVALGSLLIGFSHPTTPPLYATLRTVDH